MTLTTSVKRLRTMGTINLDDTENQHGSEQWVDCPPTPPWHHQSCGARVWQGACPPIVTTVHIFSIHLTIPSIKISMLPVVTKEKGIFVLICFAPPPKIYENKNTHHIVETKRESLLKVILGRHSGRGG